MVRTYRDLVVWQKSMCLVTNIYETTKPFPRDEMFGLATQMRRCAVSIPSNIAEGFGRKGTGDFLRFLSISIGSLFELQTQIEIAMNLGYINTKVYEKIFTSSREIERMLSALIAKLRNKP